MKISNTINTVRTGTFRNRNVSFDLTSGGASERMQRNNTNFDMHRTLDANKLGNEIKSGAFVRNRRNTSTLSHTNNHLNNHSSVTHNILS